MPCGINCLLQPLNIDLFEHEDYTLSHWVDENGEIWDFENDTVTENMVLYAIWNHIPSHYLFFSDNTYGSVMNTYFSKTYFSPETSMVSSISTKNVTIGEPINLCSRNDSNWKVELENARDANNGIKHYGGCGPIAMISVMEYFARVMGYRQIMEDGTTSSGMTTLATEVYGEVNTIAFGLTNEDKDVGTTPSEFVRAFNQLMVKNGLSGKISATYHTRYCSLDVKLELIKNSIDNGLPVTCYTIFREGEVGSHYINIYGYEEWEVCENGNITTHTFLKIRPNIEDGEIKNYLLECEFLDSSNVGLLYYTIGSYDKTEEITAEDFSEYFTNDGTAYMTDSNYIEMHNEEEYYFKIKRINTACINNKLTASINVNNNRSAGLYLKFSENIKRITFDLSIYNANQNFINNTSLEIKYFDNIESEWITSYTYNLSDFSNELNNIVVYFPYEISEFFIRITSNNSMTSQNICGIKIDNIQVSYNFIEQHVHAYSFTSTSSKHTATCTCGESFTESHTFKTNLVMGQLVKSCTECGYVVKNDDFVLASIEEEEFNFIQ